MRKQNSKPKHRHIHAAHLWHQIQDSWVSSSFAKAFRWSLFSTAIDSWGASSNKHKVPMGCPFDEQRNACVVAHFGP